MAHSCRCIVSLPMTFWYITLNFFYRRANDVLRIETMMFEKYLKRVDPKDIMLQAAATSKILKLILLLVSNYLLLRN